MMHGQKNIKLPLCMSWGCIGEQSWSNTHS